MLSLAKWLRFRRKRRSLNWLSIHDVIGVRDRIINLYLAPGDKIRAASPKHIFGTGTVDISFSGWPQFDFEYNPVGLRVKLRALLKFDKRDQVPYWDVTGNRSELLRVKSEHGDYEVRDVHSIIDTVFEFGAYEPLRVVEHLIKAYAYHFPFAPTDNHLANGGNFVA